MKMKSKLLKYEIIPIARENYEMADSEEISAIF